MFIVRGGSGTAYVAGIWLASTIDALRVVVRWWELLQSDYTILKSFVG